MLEVDDIEFAYGGSKAVDGCSFVVADGQVTGLIGPNGAGKSTLLEIIAGGLAPSRGRLVFNGVEIQGMSRAQVAQQGIIRTFQTTRELTRLPVLENVVFAAPNQIGENVLASLFWRRRWASQEAQLRARAEELLAWVGLTRLREEPAGTLSGGQRRLLEIARALMAEPKLLLLDEPSAGVYPAVRHLIAQRIREVVGRGITVLVVAHNMAFLSEVADDVVVMAEGRVLRRGPLEEVRADQAVVAAYLGGGHVGGTS
ncbi:MAG TPA: ABC transporter ATP-binding protein [Candidatus Dormibacteraeota bacterium]|nr:ABC transporter ATP-binding protein [Candidatus Dormibacteraeota bacterium]